MAYSIGMNAEDRCVDICHHGTLTFAEISAARKEAVALMQRESLTRMFVDVREADIRGLSTVQTFQFNATHGEEFSEVWRVRISVLVKREQYRDWGFFEMVARNRGTDLRVFVNTEAARVWLRKARACE